MAAFSYLSVLLSIILGLAITQVLQGYRALLLAQERVTPYAPTLIRSALLIVFATQSWWQKLDLARCFGRVDRQCYLFDDCVHGVGAQRYLAVA